MTLIVHRRIPTAYGVGPSGLPGNDDLGTMSAWYVFAAIGMFPQSPGRAEMLLGSPIFTRVVLDRSNGVRLMVNANSTDPYVQSVRLDNRRFRKSWLPESFARRGGTVSFTVGSSANTTWATTPAGLPQDQ
jgi:putative alpha-1,2-mannosidase